MEIKEHGAWIAVMGDRGEIASFWHSNQEDRPTLEEAREYADIFISAVESKRGSEPTSKEDSVTQGGLPEEYSIGVASAADIQNIEDTGIVNMEKITKFNSTPLETYGYPTKITIKKTMFEGFGGIPKAHFTFLEWLKLAKQKSTKPIKIHTLYHEEEGRFEVIGIEALHAHEVPIRYVDLPGAVFKSPATSLSILYQRTVPGGIKTLMRVGDRYTQMTLDAIIGQIEIAGKILAKINKRMGKPQKPKPPIKRTFTI